MKKWMMLLLAASMSLAPQAFAQEEVYEGAYDVEEGPMPAAELNGKMSVFATPVKQRADGEVIAGAIIGAIVGAIAADALDDQLDRHGRNDRWDHRGPHRPGRPGRHQPYPPRHRQQVVCYAQNHFGQVFRAIGNRAQAAQRQALNNCQRNSHRCRAMGCQVVGR